MYYFDIEIGYSENSGYGCDLYRYSEAREYQGKEIACRGCGSEDEAYEAAICYLDGKYGKGNWVL